MKLVLLIDNKVIADVYAIALEGYFNGSSVVSARLLEEAFAKVKDQKAQCLVTDFPIDQLLKFLKAYTGEMKKVPLLALSDAQFPAGETFESATLFAIPAQASVRELVEKVEAVTRTSSVQFGYSKISIRTLLLKGVKIRSDVFIKLSEDNYVKVLGASDTFDEEQYERFRAKGVDYLYLTRQDFLLFMENLLRQVNILREKGEPLDLGGSTQATLAIFETIHSAFPTEGFTPQMRELAESTIGLAMDTLKRNHHLKDLLAKLDAQKDSYIGWSSTALAFLSCKLATAMGWSSEGTFYKLALAALLHDLTLPRDSLAKVQDLNDLRKSTLSAAEKDTVLKHPYEAAKLTYSFSDVPGEVGFIIEQHHERPDGTGFPRGLDYKEISPISALFIIAHEMVHEIFTMPNGTFNLAGYVQKKKDQDRYGKGSFGHVISVIANGVGQES